jgi:lysophospholipid acyltransferase (LPLAT)-like uncharacterized protein
MNAPFSSLSHYPFKKRFIIKFAGVAFYYSIKVIGALTRFDALINKQLIAIESSGTLPIYAYWHDRMFLTTYILRNRGTLFLTSRSFDGEYLARIMQRFGFAVIRGSSSSGGSEALAALTKSMGEGHAASLTVDGPRGPRYESKIGAIILAKRTGNPVVPIIVESKKHRKMNSWDRLQIPLPFSSAIALFGEPIYVDQDADQTEIDAKHRELQDSLDALVERGREWRESR